MIELAEALLARITDDNSRHGGLSSRETIRAADELRIAINRHKRGLTDDDINLMIDNAAVCSQANVLIDDEAIRECIRLNVKKLGWTKP